MVGVLSRRYPLLAGNLISVYTSNYPPSPSIARESEVVPSLPPVTAALYRRAAAVGESAGAGGSEPPSTRQPTRAELYRAAQQLDIPGRSTMTRDELAAAVAAAGGTQPG